MGSLCLSVGIAYPSSILTIHIGILMGCLIGILIGLREVLAGWPRRSGNTVHDRRDARGFGPRSASMFARAAAFGRANPFSLSLGTATAKTAAADTLTQICLEGSETLDTRR